MKGFPLRRIRSDTPTRRLQDSGVYVLCVRFSREGLSCRLTRIYKGIYRKWCIGLIPEVVHKAYTGSGEYGLCRKWRTVLKPDVLHRAYTGSGAQGLNPK